MRYACLWVFALGVAALRAEEAQHAPGAVAAPGAEFKEGRGIIVSEATKAAIGLTVTDVGEERLTTDVRLVGQVYRTAGEVSQNRGERPGFAHASAMVSEAGAREWESYRDIAFDLQGGVVTGRVCAVDRTMLAAGLQQVDLLLEIPDPGRTLKIGSFVPARPLDHRTSPVMVVPRAAILRTAQDTFVYVHNGDAFLRTPVTLGVQGADAVQIVDGLYEGDAVAASAVETLYLIELRATKGGGHCH
ncbi:MAG: hypothetical protein K8T26_06560 [Lentisphaerae bacterium]|nr:hypothetical protein [Lentisphaerota bacterium]